jgi:hypothetical protein
MVTAYNRNTPTALTNLVEWLSQLEAESIGKAETKTTAVVAPATLFMQTLGLRRNMHAVLQLRDPRMRSRFGARLARWIMTDWGGVDRKRQESCKKIFARTKNWQPHKNLDKYEKAARWSKVLAFCRPQEAAILDARVVYSLNWYMRKAKKARRFPTLPSENSLMSVLDHSGFVASERMGWEKFEDAVDDDIQQREARARIKSQIRKVIEGPSDVMSKKEAYPYYIKIISRVAKKLFGNDVWGITKTEMMLFGLATTTVAREVCSAICKGSVNPTPVRHTVSRVRSISL